MKELLLADYCAAKTMAVRLDCSETTVISYSDRGLLPRPRKIGGMVRWKWSEVEAMLDMTETEENSEPDPILAAINGR